MGAARTFLPTDEPCSYTFFFVEWWFPVNPKKFHTWLQNPFSWQLPIILADSMLFSNSASLSMELAQDDAIIRYTLDGQDVTANSSSYLEPLELASTTEVKVRAFHSEFKPSESQSLVVRKLEKNISSASVKILPQPNSNYPGDGAVTLIDTQKGSLNFRKGKFWLGFQENQITADLKFSESTVINSLIVSVLQDHDSWIFAPKTIKASTNGRQIGAIVIEKPDSPKKKKLLFIEVPVQKGSYQDLTITITPLPQIPEWHQGKGTLPWVFMDEIMVE